MLIRIDDSNWQQFFPNGINVQGGEPRYAGINPRAEHPRYGAYGSAPFATPWNRPLIPMELWPDLIADQTRNRSRPLDIWREAGIGVLDQDGLSYCHAFSAVLAVMIKRAQQGLPYVELSAGSVGGPVTGYRNRGAWVLDDLEQCVKGGVASTEFVPMRQVSRSGWKPGAEENAKLHMVIEWMELQRRNFQQQCTAILSGDAVPNGLNYWGHSVCDVAVVDAQPSLPATDERRYEIDFINSWGKGWSEDGIGRRAGSKKYCDEQYIVAQIVASPN